MTISRKEYQVSDFPRYKNGKVHSLFMDLTGSRYGRLKVLSFWGNDRHGTKWWNCVCDCGNKTITKASNMRDGTSTSCGCYTKEVAKSFHTTHGLTHHKYRAVWQNMTGRCSNPNHAAYPEYGAKGISVCDEWSMSNPEGIKNFCDYMDNVMPRPSDEKTEKGMPVWTLDRINPYGNYEPSNVRWATWEEQNNNQKKHWDHSQTSSS